MEYRLVVYLLVMCSSLFAAEKPNLLFILSDDQRDDSFSGMGHPWIETPNVDTLLSKGIRFENAYIAEPTCNPSRAAILLGVPERVNRLGFSSAHAMTTLQWADSYPVLLQKAGYKTGFVGKWHVQKEKELQFETMFDYFKGHHGHGQFYIKHKNPDGSEKMVTTNRHHTDNALEFLRTERCGGPFSLSICYATPHGSKVYGMHKAISESASRNKLLQDHPIYGGRYRDLDIAYPQQNPEDPYQHIPKDVMNQDAGRSRLYRYDYDPVSNKEHHYRYYQMITEIDEMVGELVAELEKQGLAENTIIVYGSDHGVLMGEYGMGGKALLYDLILKFPCFIYDPSTPQNLQGVNRNELVSSVDLTATFLDYAGVKPSAYMTGRSLKPLVRGQELRQSWRKGLFLENMYTGRDTPLQEGYVDGSWKYIRCYKKSHPFQSQDVDAPSGEPVYEMLFSLKNDPSEKKNLINNPEYKQKHVELQSKCDAGLAAILEVRRGYSSHYEIKK